MQLTQYSDYALRLLMYLGLNEHRLCSIAEIASAYGISKNHLVKVAHHLTKSGFVEAVRGRSGGLRLARPAARIKLGAVYRVTEPGFALADCFEDASACRVFGACVLRRALDEALRRFLATLDGYTLADLLGRPAPLEELLEIGPPRGVRARASRAKASAPPAASAAAPARARPRARRKVTA